MGSQGKGEIHEVPKKMMETNQAVELMTEFIKKNLSDRFEQNGNDFHVKKDGLEILIKTIEKPLTWG